MKPWPSQEKQGPTTCTVREAVVKKNYKVGNEKEAETTTPKKAMIGENGTQSPSKTMWKARGSRQELM